MWLGSGVIGGIGLGLGYISPVSTLVKWFPDRRGMATGMAIMGFGGGAMIGAPLANLLMNYFKTPTSVGVWETFVAMGVDLFRVHDDRRVPLSHSAGRLAARGLDAAGKSQCDDLAEQRSSERRAQDAAVLADLVGALPERLGGHRRDRHGLADAAGNLRRQADRLARRRLQPARRRRRRRRSPAIAAGFAGLLSLFNIGGRFFWASLSDKIGRKNTYYTFFILGIVLYALAPTFAAMGSKLLFVLGFGIILSMYGGGFATVPAYLADMFGTQFVGAIHGRLLTAWSTAGIIGPVVVNYIREFQLAAGVPRDQLYNTTMYILCAMLIAGLICNYLIKPVDPKWHMSEAEVAKLQAATASAGGIGTVRLVRHRVRRARRQGRAVLGLRRHSARLGRVEDAGKRRQDPLIDEDAAGPPASASRGVFQLRFRAADR